MSSLVRSVIRRQFIRWYTSGCDKQEANIPNRIKKLKKKQQKFGVDDGVPVYLKGGASDKLLFQICLGGLAVGFAMALHVFYTLIVPGKRLEWLKNMKPPEEEE